MYRIILSPNFLCTKLLQNDKNTVLKMILKRDFSNAELSTVLRPFYFVVHPDLFGQYPEQRTTNEESLKHLSVFIESLKTQKSNVSLPTNLKFYIRDKESRGDFKQISIRLERHQDIKQFIKCVLKSCDLSTEKIDKMKITASRSNTKSYTENEVKNHPGSIFEEYEFYHRNIKKAKQEKTLQAWIKANVETSRQRCEALQGIRDEVMKLEEILIVDLKLKGIQYDCGWNIEHIRGCLKSLYKISKMLEENRRVLEGRTIVLSHASGVSLEGHVMFFTGDVQHTWLDFIKNIPKQDEHLKKIPAYEKALSQVLLNISVSRRKFMPKAQVTDYASYLCKVTTTLLDYLAQHSRYPRTWPQSLQHFQIVIESEAGPLMVSPTGQFIAPSTCPGWILVDFITTHIDEAFDKILKYDINKHIEISLHEKCIEKLKLNQLTKDDSVDPEKMIKCLERLLNTDVDLADCVVNITNYFSVLSDGMICIPWDWQPD